MAVQQVLYTSATGFTERYAQMLGEAAALPGCRAGGPGAWPPPPPPYFFSPRAGGGGGATCLPLSSSTPPFRA